MYRIKLTNEEIDELIILHRSCRKDYIMPLCPDRNFLSYPPMQPFVVLHNN
jgi:hypothetical protein